MASDKQIEPYAPPVSAQEAPPDGVDRSLKVSGIGWILLGLLSFLTLIEAVEAGFFTWRFIAESGSVRSEAIKPMLVGMGGFAFFGFLTIFLWRKYTQGAKKSANKSQRPTA